MLDKIANAEPVEYKIENAHCCHISCDNKADYEIIGPNGSEDYTHMCKDHVEEHVRDEDKVWKL